MPLLDRGQAAAMRILQENPHATVYNMKLDLADKHSIHEFVDEFSKQTARFAL